MSKILVDLYLPVLQKSFDVAIPLTMQLHQIEPILISALKDMTKGYYDFSQPIILCDRETGKEFDINQTPYELRLKNGSRLMLI